MRILIVFFLLQVCCYTLTAQPAFSAKKIKSTQIPVAIKFRGKPEEAWTWIDKTGENFLITSIVPSYKEKKTGGEIEDDAFSAELHAFHFVKKDTAYKLLWKISDSQKNCSFDLEAGFIKESIRITDLDNDGIAESIIQYKLACRSDVSPAQMKLIMHEDSTKFALRGLMWIETGQEDKFTVTGNNVNLETWKEYKGTEDEWEKLAGRYQTEKDFMDAPKEFLNFARQQWLLFVKESFE